MSNDATVFSDVIAVHQTRNELIETGLEATDIILSVSVDRGTLVQIIRSQQKLIRSEIRYSNQLVEYLVMSNDLFEEIEAFGNKFTKK